MLRTSFVATWLTACAATPLSPAVTHPSSPSAPPSPPSPEPASAPSSPTLMNPNEQATERDLATIAVLKRAHAQYQAFLDRAGNDPHYQDAVARSRTRQQDLLDLITFLEQGIAERHLASQHNDTPPR